MRRQLVTGMLASIILGSSATPAIAQSYLNLRGRAASEWFSDPKLAELANAAASGDVKLIDKLAKDGVSIDGMSSKGEVTPLVFALAMQNYAGSKRLLELGANPNRQVVIDQSKGTLFSFIVMSQKPALTELLLQFKADPNVVSNADTPLMRAVRNRPNIELLLKYGANVNYDDGFGLTVGTLAAIHGELDNVKLFLDAGLNVELDELARMLQDRVYRPELEPRRLELLSMLRAKGVKLRYSKHNPDTPHVSLPEYTPADYEVDKATRAARRKGRGLP